MTEGLGVSKKCILLGFQNHTCTTELERPSPTNRSM